MEFSNDSERKFRSVLLRVCLDMGEETWSSFMFLLAIPESVREKKCRGDVLTYLMESGKVSSAEPKSVVSLLREDLQKDDLAKQMEEVLGEKIISSYFASWLAIYYARSVHIA